MIGCNLGSWTNEYRIWEKQIIKSLNNIYLIPDILMHLVPEQN